MKKEKKTALIISVSLAASLFMLFVINRAVDMGILQREGNEQNGEMQKEAGKLHVEDEAEITAQMRKRYGDVRFCGMDGGLYCYDTGEFTFYAQNDTDVGDNYEMAYYRYLTDLYFSGRNRAHDYEQSGAGIHEVYIPVIYLNSFGSEEKEWFCSDVTNWLLSVMEKIPYEEEDCVYKTIGIAYGKERYTYQFINLGTLTEESVSGAYNEIYDFIEKLSEADRGQAAGVKKTDNSLDVSRLPEETVQYYLSLEPECTDMSGKTEYRMVGVDRACGSSYYALIAVGAGEELVMVNTDPYLGSGGTSMWITFLEDGQTGFSCLAYSGGSYGSLYRTEDGGKSFEEVRYPSAKVKLPDGTYYNPFVMPERVYEEGETLYMEAGQGLNGDYYGEGGFASGLYESKDRGKTWGYVRELF